MTSEEVAKKTESELINEYNRQDLDQKLKDGKIMAVHTKKEEVVVIGGGKGKKGKKPKAQKTEAKATFNIDFAVINKFGLVAVSPPISPEDLDAKIKELTERQKTYLKEGEQTLRKEKSELENDIEKLVEEDIEAEKKQAEQEEYGDEEEEKDGERRHSHRGRGGFSKAYGGRDEVAAPKKKSGPKDEYFDGSDSEEDNGAYAKPTRGGGQQVNKGGKRGKASLMKTDDDFPTL